MIYSFWIKPEPRNISRADPPSCLRPLHNEWLQLRKRRRKHWVLLVSMQLFTSSYAKHQRKILLSLSQLLSGHGPFTIQTSDLKWQVLLYCIRLGGDWPVCSWVVWWKPCWWRAGAGCADSPSWGSTAAWRWTGMTDVALVTAATTVWLPWRPSRPWRSVWGLPAVHSACPVRWAISRTIRPPWVLTRVLTPCFH